MKWIFKLIFKLRGWTVVWDMPEEVNRCVFIFAPHTSNWDFVYGIAAFNMLKIPYSFVIKKEWMFFPIAPFWRYAGAIGVDRSPKKPGDKRLSLVEAMVELYKDRDRFAIIIAPEGTRAYREKWKTGFYHVAEQAEVPICLGYLDFNKRTAGVLKAIHPTNFEKDMKEIMDTYKTMTPHTPEKFSIDINYQ